MKMTFLLNIITFGQYERALEVDKKIDEATQELERTNELLLQSKAEDILRAMKAINGHHR